MKLTRAASLGIVLFTLIGAGCGGASEDGGRDDDTVRANDEDDEGEDGNGDDDAAEQNDDDGSDADDDANDDDDTGGNDDPDGDGTASPGDPGSAGSSDDPDVVPTPVDQPPSMGSGVAPSTPVAPGRPPIGIPGVIGGTGGEPLPPAEGCTTVAEYPGPDYCSVQQTCTEESVYTSCYMSGADSYECSCSRTAGYNNHTLTGVDATTACTVAVELCNGTVAPEYAADAVCEPRSKSTGPDYCDTQIVCTKSADLGNGVAALLQTDYQYSSCWNQGDGSLSCSCSAAGTAQNYVLNGVAPAESCDLVLGFCASGETPEWSEPATCSVGNVYNQSSGDRSYCQLEQICSQSSEVSPGVVAALSEYEYVSCETTADASRCYCSSNTDSIQFDMGSTPDAACNDALAICTSDAEIAPEGPLTCERTYQNGSGGYCDTNFECTQEAVVDGTSIGVFGNYYAYCQDMGDGSWSCTCSSGVNSTQLTVPADDAWAACTDAGELCGDAIDVQVGSGGGGVVVVMGGSVGVANPAPRPTPASR